MRYLVLGATGMAGHTIALYLKERGHSVAGFSRRSAPFLDERVEGDARDVSILVDLIREGGFDVVINCVGILNRYAEEDAEGAAYLNGELPHILSRIAEGIPTRIFHMSTDCVFAGNTGPYTEISKPDGGTVYDCTKAAGELDDTKNLTFRCSVVGPDMNPSGIGLLNWFMQKKGAVKGYTHAIWTGLTTLELAKAIECASRENVSGLVNMVPESSITKYDLLQLFNDELRSGMVEILPDDSLVMDKALLRTNFDCSFIPRDYQEQVAEMGKWIRLHSNLYSHYVLSR